jgi:hypothetical protein
MTVAGEIYIATRWTITPVLASVPQWAAAIALAVACIATSKVIDNFPPRRND